MNLINNIVKLYHNENRSKKSLANEYGVHPTTISHWIKRAKLVELPDGGVTSVEAFKQLQKENQQLKEENEMEDGGKGSLAPSVFGRRGWRGAWDWRRRVGGLWHAEAGPW